MTRWVLSLYVGVGTLPVPLSLLTPGASPSSPVSRVVYNGKRNSSPRSPTNSSEIFTPAHEENVRFIYEGWCTGACALLLLPAVGLPAGLVPDNRPAVRTAPYFSGHKL